MLICGERDTVICKTSDVVPIMKEILAAEENYDQEKEHLWSIGLDSTGRILFIDLVALGGITQASVSIWSILMCALKRKSCAAVILVHNHDFRYGSKEPSQQDLDVCKQVLEMLKCALIELRDFLIISAIGYISLREAALLKKISERVGLDEISRIKEDFKTLEEKVSTLRLSLDMVARRQCAEAKDDTTANITGSRLNNSQGR